MSLAASHDVLVSAVGNRLAEEVGRMPVKEAARLLDTSLPTIGKMRKGDLPSAAILLRAVQKFGLKLLEPVLGPMDDASLARRLDAILADVGELKHAVSQSATRSQNPDGLLVARGRGGDTLEGRGDSQGELFEQARRSEFSGLALVETRTPADAILARASCETLRRHLNEKVVSLDAARALVKGDNLGRTGLAFRRSGEDWSVLPARENRLWSPENEARPIAQFHGDVARLRRSLTEASRSAEPIFVTHAGGLIREGEVMSFHSAVVRIGGKLRCGSDYVLTDFARQA